jgi:RNA ligase (TIGR02306 family)
MSEFHVRVVELHGITPHPNADTLSIVQVDGGYPCVIRTGEFEEGSRAVYVPVDSLVPVADERFAFMASGVRTHECVKAKKLRGIFSMGLLVRADASWALGQDVCAELGITKYEPPEPSIMNGENERDPGFMPCYTDVEGLRKYGHLLCEGEEVVVTEKLHGASMRSCYRDGRLWVGSHTCIKRESETNLWWKVARQYELAAKLAQVPGIILYGEVFGQVQDLRYGAGRGQLFFAVFDALNSATHSMFQPVWLGQNDLTALCTALSLPTVPVLYRGPWSESCRLLAEGKSTLADNVGEGIVVRPVPERYEQELHGRLVLKLHGEGFLLRKEHTP